MVQTVIVPDVEEILKLANSLPVLSSGVSKPVSMLTTGREQLVIIQNGIPAMAYKVPIENGITNEKISMEIIKRFVENLHERKHLVMLYDDPKLARFVEFSFIKEGLEKSGEKCVYMLPDDDIETIDSIKRKMNGFGINTSYYMNNGSLDVTQISDPSKDTEGFLLCCERLLERLKSDPKPKRVVLHVKYRFNTSEELETHAEFENLIQTSFRDFNGSMLCNHYIGRNNNEPSKLRDWNKKMLETHDNVFLIRDSWLEFLA